MKNVGRYKVPCDLQHEAAEAMHHALSLYKAAGSPKRAVVDVVENLWGMTKAATPEDEVTWRINGIPVYPHGPIQLHAGDEIKCMGKFTATVMETGLYFLRCDRIPEKVEACAV